MINTTVRFCNSKTEKMFSDEPHFGTAFLPLGDKDKKLPWTTDFDDTFKAEFGVLSSPIIEILK